jgi:tetratricopeptide (TPR) repeat protein
MYLTSLVSRTLLVAIMMMLLCSGSASATIPDDSALFMEAFNAYQKKDYLLVVEKIEQLNQLFPDTPLRDLSLLFQARASYRSGDYEQAAKIINQFGSEFADSPLRTSVETDLTNLGVRLKKGEKLLPNKQLKTAAQKVRNDQLALERAAALKAEQERLAREKAELQRIAKEKADAERRELERLAAEKAAKESIKLAIVFPTGSQVSEVGKEGEMPVELVNNGSGREEFRLILPSATEYAPGLTLALKAGEALERVVLEAGEARKGVMKYKLPASRVDGFNLSLQLKAVSTKFDDVSFVGDAHIVAAAPLLRAIAKPDRMKVPVDEVFKYRVTVLNAGSMAAHDLTIRVELPIQLEFSDAPGDGFRSEGVRTVAIHVDSLEIGNMKEFSLNVKSKDTSVGKQDLRCKVEIENGVLKLRESFMSSPLQLQGK